MKKILFYLPFIKFGGIEKSAIIYLKELLKKNYDVRLLIDYNMGLDGNNLEPELPKELKYDFIKSKKITKFIYTFRTLGKKYIIFNIVLYILIFLFDFYYYHTKIKAFLKENDFDAIVSFYQFSPTYFTNYKKARQIIWLHGSVEHFFGKFTKIFRSKYEKNLNKYDYIVTIAREMKEQLIRFYPNLKNHNIKIIYNPFDFNDILLKSNDKTSLSEDEKILIRDKYICTVTRIDENHKDIKTIIMAYKILYDNSDISDKLYIIGDGVDRYSLEKITKYLNLEKNILFLGKKTNPYVWMKNANIFILSSKTEGFGLVLVEAMASGTFVISSNCEIGPREILNYGECGDLFEVGNAKELAKTIKFALDNKNYKKEKIQKAFARISEFDKNVIIQSLEEIL